MGPQLALIGNPATWLFSYGSNHPGQLSARIGRDVHDGQPALVEGYQRVFRGFSVTRQCGVASLQRKREAVTYGWAAKVSEAELRELDRYEGVGSGCYKRKKVKVYLPMQGKTVDGVTYVSTSREYGEPSREYLEMCARCVGAFWNDEGRQVRPEDFPLRNNPPRMRNPLPVSFTGPSITLMPFNPFQKVSVDLLGVGLAWGGDKNGNGKKNPGKSKHYHVYDKRTGNVVSTEFAPNSTGARGMAAARLSIPMDQLKAKAVPVRDVDRTQASLFGYDPDQEVERERREEQSGQMEMFNPPPWAWAIARDIASRNPGFYGGPELEGMTHEQRIRLYAERIAQGLSPFTGEAPEQRGGVTFPPAPPVRRPGSPFGAAFGRRRGPSEEGWIPTGEDLAPIDPGHDISCADCRRAVAYARARGLPPRKCRACELGLVKADPVAAEWESLGQKRQTGIRIGVKESILPTPELMAMAKSLRTKYGSWSKASKATGVAPTVLSRVAKGGRGRGISQKTVEKIMQATGNAPGQQSLFGQNPGPFTWPAPYYAMNPVSYSEYGPGRRPPRTTREQSMRALQKARRVQRAELVQVTPALLNLLNLLIEVWPSQKALADAIGFSKQYLTNLKNGRQQAINQAFYERIVELGQEAARGAANNPGPVDPRAFDMLERYKDDLAAGHLDAAEYWRGQAAAYFTANPNGPPPPGMKVIPELAKLMNPQRKRRRNRDSKWKSLPKEYEIPIEEAEKIPYFKEALARFRKFHGTNPPSVKVIQIPDGKKKKRRLPKVYVALGLRKQTPYIVPSEDEGGWKSSKADTYWYHDHPEGMEPTMILDPETGVVSDVGGSYVVEEWFYS